MFYFSNELLCSYFFETSFYNLFTLFRNKSIFFLSLYLFVSNPPEISIISEDGEIKKINLSKLLSKNNISSFVLKPHDTIYVEQKKISQILQTHN